MAARSKVNAKAERIIDMELAKITTYVMDASMVAARKVGGRDEEGES